MTREHPALAGLESVAWHELGHAYGPAVDTPELLLLLTSTSDDEIGDVIEALNSSLCHQGTVYPASVAAIEFMARLAVGGIHTVSLLELLGAIAGSDDPHGLDARDAARQAVVAQLDLLMPLTEHGQDRIRSAAIATFAATGSSDRVVAVLRRRWQVETDRAMRLDVLWAAMEADVALAAELAEDVLEDASAALRMAAALAQVQAGRAWSERLLAAGTARIPERAAGSGWTREYRLFGALVKATAEHCGTQAGIDLVVAALENSHEGPGDTLARALGGARHLVLTYRCAVDPLIAVVAELVGTDTSGQVALGILEVADERSHADVVLALAEQRNLGDLADRALACLVRLGEPRATELFAQNLPDRPRALGAAVGFPFGPTDSTLAFDERLLSAIRDRLRALGASNGDSRPSDLVTNVRNHNEPIHLAEILRHWGPVAEPATPELIGLLGQRPHPAAQTLGAIGRAGTECIAALRAAAGQAGISDQIAVGRALLTLTTDPQPLIAAILEGLGRQRYDLQVAAQAAAELPEYRDLLASRITQALDTARAPSSTRPDLQARVTLARALWRHTADGIRVLPVLRESLQHTDLAFGGWLQADAANLAAELGAGATELIPSLEQLLSDPVTGPSAVHALLAIDPAAAASEHRRDKLSAYLTMAITDGRATHIDRALDVLSELGAPLPEPAASRLRTLIDQDRRISSGTPEEQIVSEDKRLRQRMKDLLNG
ncbi:hypothetical protein [Catenulispora rubra]|uniref:hypothetical protein n=1 Tax=Catenulispora rubra TaxID=280293 RepID=UPI00189232ED|nr:hypothetical protein [Catenulispora rubra]